MNKTLKPKNILQNVLEKKITKKEAFKLLESLINESNIPEIRANAIQTLERLSIFNESTFFLLEKSLITDESDLVRFMAVRVLIKHFPLTKNTSLIYAIEHEESIYFLKKVLNLCIKSEKKQLKVLRGKILKRISTFYNLNSDDAQFILDIDYLDYMKFRENFKDFIKKFQINETEKQKLIRENAKLGYKGLGRVVKSEDGFIIGLRLEDFSEIPLSIQNLKKLEYLEIKRSNLSNLNNNFENLLNLKYLNLNNNQIESIPDWIIELVSKRNYALKYAKNGVIYKEAKLLGLLEILLGQALVKLDNRESFNHSLLYYYKTNYDGHLIGISISSDLNKIGIFPIQLCSLKFLEELYLPNQDLSNIPECISELKQLKILDLRNNIIESLPESIDELRNLKNLKLDGNPLYKNNK